jgi:ketosteroid isomerase-like protein
MAVSVSFGAFGALSRDTSAGVSRDNEEVLRRIYRLWDERDFDAMEGLIDPEGVFDVSRNVFNPGVHRGLDGFRDFAGEIDEMWAEFRVVPEDFTEVGDKLVVTHRISGRGRESGVETKMRLYAVCAFRDGRVMRVTGGFRERSEALEAAGARD